MNTAALYEPINRYKPFADDVGIVDGSFEYVSALGVTLPFPFTTRMTVVRLKSGDLFLHSPIKYDLPLAQELRQGGEVRHLVSPNKLHYAHIGEWSRAFPDAMSWASPGVRERARSRRIDVDFKRDLDSVAPPEWRDEIEQLIIPGGVLKEVVFFHKESKTLMLADTIMNFESDKMNQPWRLITRLTGVSYPNGRMPLDMRLSFLPRRRQVGAVFEKILSWHPERVIFSHGRCFESDGETRLRRAFKWALPTTSES